MGELDLGLEQLRAKGDAEGDTVAPRAHEGSWFALGSEFGLGCGSAERT